MSTAAVSQAAAVQESRTGIKPADRYAVAKGRAFVADRFMDEETKILKIFGKYDQDNSGTLNLSQLKMLLTDYSGGTPPSEDELSFVMRVADQNANNAMDKSEVLYALKVWLTYVHEHDRIEAVFRKYDTDMTGSLDRSQFLRFLEDLNDNNPVSELECDWVMAKGDRTGNGEISKIELMAAVSAWYGHVQEKKEREERDKKWAATTSRCGCCIS